MVVQPVAAGTGLASRALLQAGGQYAAHDHFLHVAHGDASTLDRFGDGQCAKVDRRDAGQAALKSAHRGACAADDNNAVVGHV